LLLELKVLEIKKLAKKTGVLSEELKGTVYLYQVFTSGNWVYFPHNSLLIEGKQ